MKLLLLSVTSLLGHGASPWGPMQYPIAEYGTYVCIFWVILQEVRILWRLPILAFLVIIVIFWFRIRGGKVDRFDRP